MASERDTESRAKGWRNALRFKHIDVEEPIDVYLHRPAAAILTAGLVRLPVTPNQVTLASLFFGWAAALALYQGFFGDWLERPAGLLLASALLFVSVVLDCADGQLARLRGGGSPAGRALDGIVDALVLIPNYVLVGLGIAELYEMPWFVLACVAGVSAYVQCNVYDRIKTLYLRGTSEDPGSVEGNERPEQIRIELRDARREGAWLDSVVLRVYLLYLEGHARLIGGGIVEEQARNTAEQIGDFRRAHRRTMHLASLLGLGTHMLFFYATIALAALWPEALLVQQLAFAVSFNVLMAIVLHMSREIR